ncbi:complement factor B-like [Myxocyprinus asiaticus]|uniref:complement factor B-like n=1 Tax=Myxocyprinus asiaticus TaxID=70543 RepID=UPI0022233847|nr:complement factor B-like [Myxocyprinus asiaticus]
MECKKRWHWLMLELICLLIAGAPSSMSKRHESCPKDNVGITGGTFVLSNGYSHGSILTYSCQEGYYPSVKTRLCRNGLWETMSTQKTKNLAECKKVTCPDPRSFQNGEVIPIKGRYFVNDTINYACNSDYTLRGSASRVCKPNGKWSGKTAICGRDSDYCPDPGIPPGTRRTNHIFNIDDDVTYECDKPLVLIGSTKRVCQDGGHWSGTEPECYAHFAYDTPDEVSDAFSSSLKTTLGIFQQYEESDQHGKKISLDRRGKLDIYIAVDASDSIDESNFNQSKEVIKELIKKISYYQVSPNYEILMFATDVTPIVTMRNFKTTENGTIQKNVLDELDNFQYESKGERSGTNIAKAYSKILESMKIEEIQDKESFLQTQHIVIIFTDGQANMGGNPKPKVEQIKHLVTQNDPKREKKLDLYFFGIGTDVRKEDAAGLVSEKDNEKHFFSLQNLYELQETFDQMLDESTAEELCGIQESDAKNRRRAFPWLAQIDVTRVSKSSKCMGSLVTSRYILTAAHCFKHDDTPERISVKLQKGLDVKIKQFILHPDYNITAKQHMQIKEYYEFDVALIELENAVNINVNLRPICIPCTRATNGALKLSDSEGTCQKHEENLLIGDSLEAYFTSGMDKDNTPQSLKNIKIKLKGKRDACVEDAKKAPGIGESTNAKDIITDNFLCSGGIDTTTDDIACKGDRSGTNIAQAYGSILESMRIEKINDKNFLDTQHIIIMFTDGLANMGGNPRPKVEQIKDLVIHNDPSRDEKLDMYVFGMGDEVNSEDINDLKTNRGNEKFFFKLKDLDSLEKTFDGMIDEGTSVSLCGLYRDYDDGLIAHERWQYPWLVKIRVTRNDGTVSNCMGSLVTSSFILTAAHCFRFQDTPDRVQIEMESGSKEKKVKKYIPHPRYNVKAKLHLGIPEYYEFDIALIQLQDPVIMGIDVRPICIPCTKETSGALKLSDSQSTCKKHQEVLMSSETVNAAFMSDLKPEITRKDIKIKQGKWRDVCVEDAKKAKNINATNAKDIVTDNFLCSGGTEPTKDDIACKGDSGGAVFVLPGTRMIQVGVVSWGVKDMCKHNLKPDSVHDSRDYHTNLFSPDIRSFLKQYLGDGQLGTPLTFL